MPRSARSRHRHPRRPASRCAPLLAAAVLVAGVTDLAAQDPARPDTAAADTTAADTTVYQVEGIVVHGARPVATLDGASAVEVHVDSLSLEPAPTLEQVLRALPIVQIRTNSRGEAHFAMRGAQERQIAVLVDGVPVTLGWDHRQDLSIVPMLAAQDIRLARGLPSMLAGPNVLGGVVEVNVARGTGPLEEPQPFTANAGIDHVGARSLGAAVARRFEPEGARVIARAGAGVRRSPGQPLADGVSPAAGSDDLRVNSDDERLDGFVALRYRSDAGRWLSLAASGFQAERGVPPENHVDDPRLWRYPSVGQFFTAVSGGTGQVETPLGMGDVEVSIGFERGRAEIDEYATPAYGEVVGGETGETRTLSLRLLGDHSLGTNGELRAAATLADVLHDEVLRPTLAERYTNRYQQRLWSVAGELSWRLPTLPPTGGALYGARLTGGVAVDGAYTPRTGGHAERPPIRDYGARLGFSALAGDGDVRVHAGVSRRARFPSLRELYSAALGKFEPNPELGPETLVAGEAGVTAHLAGGEIQAVGFHHRLRDAIARTSSDVAKYKRINRDEIRSTGVELLGSWALGPVGISGDVTFQRVRVLDPAVSGDASDAEYNPEIAGGLDVSTPLPFDVRGSASAEYMGRQWCVVPGGGDAGMSLDPYGRVDVRLSRSFGRGSGGPLSALDATLAVDNVTDDAIYDQCGLPQPGRTLRLQFRVR